MIMKILQDHYFRKGFDHFIVDRNNKAAIYAQVKNNRIIAFEVFRVIVIENYFLDGVEIEGGEIYPGDNAFGVTAWSCAVIGTTDNALKRAYDTFYYLTNTNMEKQVINQQDEQVITDAVRMLKSQFITLYSKQGFDPLKTGLAWHLIRTSPKGQVLMRKLKQGSHVQVLTNFTDDQAIDEEIQLRKKKIKRVEDKVQENTVQKKETKSNNNNMAKGEKGKQIRDLIDQGVTDVSVLMEKSGASKLYVNWVLKNAKKKNEEKGE